MGGIKNKLSKLSNKVKNLLTNNKPLPTKGGQMTKSSEGLTIPLSDYRLTSPFSQRGTKNTTSKGSLSLKLGSSASGTTSRRTLASKVFDDTGSPLGLAEGSIGWWGRITKYTSLACLTLAILSTLVLNIVSSYSSSSIESNAETADATLSNDATALANSSSLSISFSNATGSCTDTSNPANVCIEIPDGGGIATGGHTVEVGIPEGSDLELTVSSKSDVTSLTSGDNSIPTVSTDIDNVDALPDKTWCMGFDGNGSSGDCYGLRPSSNPLVIGNTRTGEGVVRLNRRAPAVMVTYGVSVADTTKVLAGEYTADVVYTATAVVPPATLSNLVLNDTLLTGQQKEFAVQGTNLDTATRVKLCHADDQYLCYVTDDVTTYSGTDQAKTIMSFITPDVDITGVYDVIVEAAGGEARLDDSLRVIKQSVCMNGVNADSDCQVDIDDNMIPIRYTGNNPDGSAIWVTVSDNEIDHNPGLWYDYGKKQWANAVTVTSSSLSKYKNKSQVTVNESDVLGYWVYIPRYAYEVQRPNAVDRVVADEVSLPDNIVNDTWETNSHAIKNDFIIHFEKSVDGVKTPAITCNNLNPTKAQMWQNGTPVENASMSDPSILAKDYRTTCVNERGISRDYTTSSSSDTTWATHPAFIWGNTQLNGFWVGKFEATGVESQLTIKPNQASLTGSSNNPGGTIGEVYTAAKGVGQYDSNNNGGSTISGLRQNSHNLSRYKSHMIKNSEWGATAYLSASYYGAGVGNIARNTVDSIFNVSSSGVGSRTVTGCGSNFDTNSFYTRDGTQLTQSVTQSLTACSQDMRMAYNGEFGKLASTTNNVYGVYDMNAGGADMVAANASYSTSQSSTYSRELMGAEAVSPYVDLYLNSSIINRPDWSVYPYVDDGSGIPFSRTFGSDTCTWESCGGDALHETLVVQSVGKSVMYSDAAWGGLAGASFFEKIDPNWGYGSVDNDHSWMKRGGNVATEATPWSYSAGSGKSGRNYMGGATTHVVLLAQ